MELRDSPFPSGWFTSGPEVLWAVGGTYALIPYEILPTLPPAVFDGSLSWLSALPVQGTGLHYETHAPERTAGIETLPLLVAEARSLGLVIPPALIRFISDPDLRDRVWSCTDCYLDLSRGLIEDPAERGGRMLRFMNDSQACVLWYVYLAPNGDHCILASGEWHFGFRDEPERRLDPALYFWSAPHFEHFLLRFWLENLIWKRVRCGEVPTSDEARYYQAAVAARGLLQGSRIPPARGMA